MLKDLRNARAVVAVDVTVQEELRLVAVEQLVEALKAAVCHVVEVVDVTRGRMGDEHVEALVTADFPPQLADAAAHLSFGEHVFAFLVADGAAQTDKAQSLVFKDVVVDADAALRLAAEVVVVIAVYVDQRDVHHGDEKLEVLHAQVAAAHDQLDSLYLFG